MTGGDLEIGISEAVAAWNILGQLNLVDGAFNHISYCAFREGSPVIALNPEEGVAGSILKEQFRTFDLTTVQQDLVSHHGVNPDGLRLHTQIHAMRQRSGCAIHLHAPNSVAVSATESGLLPLTQTAIEFSDRIAVIEYSGLAREGFENEQLARVALEGGEALLRNHGLLVVADNPIEALYAAYYIEEACRLQVLTLSQGLELHYPSRSVIDEASAQLRQDRPEAARVTFNVLCSRFGISV